MEEDKQDSRQEISHLVWLLGDECCITKDAMAEMKAALEALVKAVHDEERQQEVSLEILPVEAKQ